MKIRLPEGIMTFIKKRIYEISFFLILFILSLIFYNGFCDLTELPYSMHQWKQSMHYSIILNYLEPGSCFWAPEIHNLYTYDLTGTLILEFPLFHKLTALIIQYVPNSSPVIFRWFMFALTVFSYYYAYKLAFTVLNNKLHALLVTFLSFIIPVIVFYSSTYMVDIPAMALAFPAIYFFEKHLKKHSVLNILLFSLFLSLSGLLRLPVIIFPLAYFGARLFKKKDFFQIFWVVPSFLIIVAWYAYVGKYNSYNYTYPPNLTYNYIPDFQIEKTWYAICNFQLYQFGWTYRSILFYIGFGLFMLFYWRKLSRFWFIVFAFMSLGSAIYGFLWFAAFEHHDYYMIPGLPLFFLIWLIIFDTAARTDKIKYLKIVSYVILGINTINTFDNMKNRTFRPNIKMLTMFSGTDETLFWNFAKQEDEGKWRPIRELSPYRSDILLKNGIHEGDTVICDFDYAPTYVLGILNLKGWTTYNSTYSSLSDYKLRVNQGAKYLICSKLISPLQNTEDLKELKKHFMFSYMTIEFYNIEHLK